MMMMVVVVVVVVLNDITHNVAPPLQASTLLARMQVALKRHDVGVFWCKPLYFSQSRTRTEECMGDSYSLK